MTSLTPSTGYPRESSGLASLVGGQWDSMDSSLQSSLYKNLLNENLQKRRKLGLLGGKEWLYKNVFYVQNKLGGVHPLKLVNLLSICNKSKHIIRYGNWEKISTLIKKKSTKTYFP